MEIEAIPDNFELYSSSTKLGAIQSRVNSYIAAQPQSGYKPLQMISIPLGAEFYDLRNSSLQFTITGTKSGGTYARFGQDIRCIFARLTIQIGSKTIVDINNYGLMCSALDYLKDPNWAESVGKLCYGASSNVANRNADFNNPNKVYSVQLYNLLNHAELLSQALPLQQLNSQFQINLYLQNANLCCESDATSVDYTVNMVQYHLCTLTPSPAWTAAYNQRIPRGISYNFINIENAYDTSILQAGVSRVSKNLNFRYTSLLSLFFLMRPSAGLQTLATNNKMTQYDFNALNGLQVRVSSLVTPTDINCSASDLYGYVMEVFNKSTQSSTQLAIGYDSNSFIGCINLSKHPWSSTSTGISINGLNTSIASSVILDMQFSTPLPANYSLDIFAISENSLVFQQNGGIVWEN